MRKEDLKALGLTDEQVDNIFKMRGKEIEAEKAKHSLLASEKASVEEAYSNLKENIDKEYVHKDKVKAIKSDKVELEKTIESLKQSHEAEVNKIKYDTVLDKHLSDFKVKSNYANFVKDLLDKDSLTFEDGKINGIDDALNNIKEGYSEIFEADSSMPKFTQRQNDGSQGGGFVTKESIMSIKDTKERLEAIQNNQELFL